MTGEGEDGKERDVKSQRTPEIGTGIRVPQREEQTLPIKKRRKLSHMGVGRERRKALFVDVFLNGEAEVGNSLRQDGARNARWKKFGDKKKNALRRRKARASGKTTRHLWKNRGSGRPVRQICTTLERKLREKRRRDVAHSL